ncbi:hypothetical protein niasHS_014058 [Heterodera schachtii]|uniref:Phospholipid/glycerol acyltransferase domain-containing protein n=1 Tax=Heterodera schachtii TaxID=97005 RepID=A0ABD2IKJ5_HETSC
MSAFVNGLRKISSVKWSTYGLAWGLITFNGAGICLCMHYIARKTYMGSPHFKKAMLIFDGHDEAKSLLGEPVKVGKLNMLDKKRNYMRKTEAGLHIPVCGTHSSGFVDVFSEKEPDESSFTMQRMVLELDDGERFLMYDRAAEEKRRKEAEEKRNCDDGRTPKTSLDDRQTNKQKESAAAIDFQQIGSFTAGGGQQQHQVEEEENSSRRAGRLPQSIIGGRRTGRNSGGCGAGDSDDRKEAAEASGGGRGAPQLMRCWWWLCCCWGCWLAIPSTIVIIITTSITTATTAATTADGDYPFVDHEQEQKHHHQEEEGSNAFKSLFLNHQKDKELLLDDDEYFNDNNQHHRVEEQLPLLFIVGSTVGTALHRLLLSIARTTTMGWPDWLQPHIDAFVLWVNGLLEYWHLGYLEYLVWLLLPIFIVFVLPIVFLFFSYGCVIFLRIYKHRNRIREAYASSVWDGARASIASFWEGVGYLWHGYEIDGLENIPDEGPGMIIAYHGPTPIDLYYVIAKGILYKKRTIHCVADKFVFKIPGWSMICKVFCMTPGTVEDCVATLRQGHLLIIAPGGVREALFSNPVTYELMWGRRLGFAKVVIGAGGVPVIPMFTENCREAFRTPRWGRRLTRPIYEHTRLPVCPIYGGFPVKMVTHLGKPLNFEIGDAVMADGRPPVSAEHIKRAVRDAVDVLIQRHQRLPGSIWRAMFQRIGAKRTTPSGLDDGALLPADAEAARKEWRRRHRRRTDREDNEQQQNAEDDDDKDGTIDQSRRGHCGMAVMVRDESSIVVDALSPSDKELAEVPLLLPSSSSSSSARHADRRFGDVPPAAKGSDQNTYLRY